MNPLDIIAKYYPVGSEAYRILVIHSRSVADKALAIARKMCIRDRALSKALSSQRSR